MKDSTGDNKTQGAEVHGNQKEGGEGGGRFKKRNSKYKRPESTNAGEFFKDLAFSVGPHRQELYQKTKELSGHYSSTQFKNRSDVTNAFFMRSSSCQK